jgi:hydrogenase maturation protease
VDGHGRGVGDEVDASPIPLDAVSRGEPPGTLFLIEPEALDGELEAGTDPHGMSLPAVFATVKAMGGAPPRSLIVGCEPAHLGETMGLSPPVERAIAPAIELVQRILERELLSIAKEDLR